MDKGTEPAKSPDLSVEEEWPFMEEKGTEATQSPHPSMIEKRGNNGKEAIESSSHPSSGTRTSVAAPIEFFKYHVFLSGKFLYGNRELKSAGLSVFEGHTCTSSPMEAIEQSKLCIPIFSPFCAFRKRHLDEVAKMHECRRKSGQIVLPIFYNVEPSDVQKQTGPFEEAFRRHEEMELPQVIDKWRKAFREIGSSEGHRVCGTFRNHPVKEIVEQVINLLANDVPLDNNNNLVGTEAAKSPKLSMEEKGPFMEEKGTEATESPHPSMEERWGSKGKEAIGSSSHSSSHTSAAAIEPSKKFLSANEFPLDQVIHLSANEVPLDNNLLGIEQSYRSVVEMLYNPSKEINVQVVGICGMPGIGKTTLARALYSNLCRFYKCCSFVSSIQERYGKNGLHSLQVELIKQLLNTKDKHLGSFDYNLQFIKFRFRKTRVLIVLDGVECIDHINAFGVGLQCFGHGSKIILTTRKPGLLVEAKVPYRYFVEELDEPNALNLFYNHAFKNDSPEEEYCHLSTQIASSTGGIPLVIESVGSYLSNYRNKEKERWEEVLQQLRSCQYEPLKEFLRLSDDYLSRGRWHFYVGERDDISPYDDVVLCFDARDKVKNLVESLHNRMESCRIGIFALNGDYIPVNDTGKIFIAVLSKNYASNSLCLGMLAHMMECRRSSATNHILPIYCAIEPSEVGLHAPPETFRLCREEEIHNLTDSVCQMVLHKLKLNQSIMGYHLVGIDHHMEGILELLKLEVNDVRVVTISGEDGAGKTTLAKLVHDRLSSNFEGCSFLAEIDERTRHYDGVKCIQAQMISDLLKMECEVYDSVIEGINLIKERFQSMKVLIILDDVTESFHVEAFVGQLVWFGPGSRIIIVTKNTTIIPLPHFNYDILRSSASNRTHELLSKKAFSKNDPLPNFISLSKRIVHQLNRSDNSCLTIEIVGSLLYGKDEAEWEYVLGKLQNGETMDLNGLLKMSFDRLNEMQKNIFLDISCFPNGMNRHIALSLWYDSVHSQNPNDIEELICLSLVKVDANNKILMHRLIKDFGREIVDQKRKDTLEKGEDGHVPIKLPALDFEMANIRYFKLDNAIIRGSRDCFFMGQRDLIWKWYPLDLLATLNAICLKVLDMSWSKITEDWEGWKQIKVPQLRVLNLRGCGDLMVTPNFSFCPYLEILILERCSRLVKIDLSIGTLRHLTILNLRNCPELSMLPEGVGCLTDLRELSLDGTSLQEIPSSIGHLKKLRFLTTINCSSLSRLPNSTHDLQFITVIKLDFTNIAELPNSIGERLKLQHLSLRGCRGVRRFALVGEVERSLVELDVSETSISELPKSIVKLQALRVLKMEFCFIMEFPPSFRKLKRLEEIHASWCRNLKSLPNDIGELVSLRILRLRHTCIFNVPESIRHLRHLQTLDFTSCDELQNLPLLPSGLTSLHVESKKLKVVPYFVSISLEELNLVSGDIRDLPDVPMAPKSTKEFTFGDIRDLPDVSMEQKSTKEFTFGDIRDLPDISLEPKSTKEFTLVSDDIRDLPDVPMAPKSTKEFTFGDIRDLPDISLEPKSTKEFTLVSDDIRDLPDVPMAPKSTKEFTFGDIRDLPDISLEPKSTKEFTLVSDDIRDLPDVPMAPKSTKEFTFGDIRDLPGVSMEPKSTKEFTFGDIRDLPDVSMEPKSTKEFTLVSDDIRDLPDVSMAPKSTKKFTLVSGVTRDFPDVSVAPKSTKEFTLVSGGIRDLPYASMASKSTTDCLSGLKLCFKLRTLRLCLPQIRDLPGLPCSLEILRLFCCRNLERVLPLPSRITVLSIQDCTSLREMPNVENLERLQEMEILRCPEIKEIEGLEGLQAMRVLTISSSGVVSLNGLDKLTSLTRLNISRSLRESVDLSTLKGVSVHWLSNADNSM